VNGSCSIAECRTTTPPMRVMAFCLVTDYNSQEHANGLLGCASDPGSCLLTTVQHSCRFGKHNVEITSAEQQAVRGLSVVVCDREINSWPTLGAPDVLAVLSLLRLFRNTACSGWCGGHLSRFAV
jgi:hypothetical protein